MDFATVDCLTSIPSFSGSPWMRGAPNRGFAPDMRRISVRTCGESDDRPICRRLFQLQNEWNARRCQATTVSGLTITTAGRASRSRRETATPTGGGPSERAAAVEAATGSARTGGAQGQRLEVQDGARARATSLGQRKREEEGVIRQYSICVIGVDAFLGKALPFSCPFVTTKSGKRQQVMAQSEGGKSPDFTSDGAQSGNAQHTAAKGG